MALRRTKRRRSLSKDGLNLFNLCLSNDPEEIPLEMRKPSKNCLRSIFFKLFTTDFDVELEKSRDKFREGTCSLYSYLDNKSVKNIPNFFNNAVANLVYLILVTDGKLNNKKKVNKNLIFYYSLAEEAMKHNDHNTAVLIRAALDNTAIRRLKTKETKKMKRVKDKFEDIYGSFLSCNARHLKAILENKDIKFLPSLLILLMHLNKTKEYAKSYRALGKFPKELEEKNNQLQNIANNYYNEYVGFREKILDLYTKDPHELELLSDCNKSNITTKLFELSYKIKN
tara:strand:- start:57 stop:908 length:852 start_codon:yes stop_codon:yes gene_type:complete